MPLDKMIYNNGVKGLLSHYEIESLPSEYEVYKSMFHDATSRKENKL